jgi:hypothetical protein
MSRDSSRDMTSPKLHGVSLGAAVIEHGQPLSCIKYNYQCVRCHSLQHSRPATLSRASCMIYHVTLCPDQSQLSYSGQSQHSLFRPITARVSSDVTPQHATSRVSSSTVVKAEGHATLHFPAKNTTTNMHGFTVHKITFRNFGSLSHLWGAHCIPTNTILRPRTQTQHLHLCFDLFFTAFFTVMPNGLTTQVQS